MRLTQPQFRSTMKRVVKGVCESVAAWHALDKHARQVVVEYEHARRAGNDTLALNIRIANKDLHRFFHLVDLGWVS